MASKYEINTKETTAFCEYSVLVVGFTGVGKSAFCNFLTDTKLFNAFEGLFGASSNEINKQQCDVLETKLTIIDCPGFGDNEKTIEEYSTEIVAYLTQHRISIDIIILVINLAKRFSQEESELFLKMSKTMGYFWEKTFCVFTHAAYLENNFIAEQANSSVETKVDYIELLKKNPKTSQELKELLHNIQNRYICIETVDKAGDAEYRTANVFKLLESFNEIKTRWIERENNIEKMEREEEIVKTTESKEEMDLMKCSTEEPMPENHHEKESETKITSEDQKEIIALLTDQNAKLKERVKLYENQQSRVDAQLKEIKEGQNKRFQVNCVQF